MKYFAYGSNMFIARIRKRVPSATRICVAVLNEHTLEFHKVSKDGSGKCDAFETGCPNDIIYGVVFEINKDEKSCLDKAEGLCNGYCEKNVKVQSLPEGNDIEVIIYYATNINDSLKPYTWYKAFVLEGAKENRLPDKYIEFLENLDAIKDPDKDSERENIAILQAGKKQ